MSEPQSPVAVERIKLDLIVARQRVSDLEALYELAVRVYGAASEATHPTAATEPDDATRDATDDDDNPSPDHGPLAGLPTREAILAVLIDAKRPVKLGDIVDTMQERGWLSTSDDPRGQVRTAIRRLISHDKLLQKVGYGTYVYSRYARAWGVATITTTTSQSQEASENNGSGEGRSLASIPDGGPSVGVAGRTGEAG